MTFGLGFSSTPSDLRYYNGLLADVRFYNVQRTQAQIQGDMNQLLTGNESGLVGYWPLNDGTGTTATDKTSNHRNGTLTGSPLPAWVTLNPTVVKIQAGTVSGPGTINGNDTNAGEMDLGSTAGTLSIIGNYTQTSAGTLSVKVGGTSAGSQYDQVNVLGTASLGGTLDASLINGFGPAVPQTFTIVTSAAVNGDFATTNFPQIDGQTTFAEQISAGNVILQAIINSPDLAVAGSSITVNGVSPGDTAGITGQNITVGWTVQNLSPTTASGSWTDSVYLSADGVLDDNSLVLGRVSHTGGLAGMSSYNGSLTTQVPGVIDGSYTVIVVTDSELVEPDLNRANNIGIAPTELPVHASELTLGTPVEGSIAGGQSIYYEVLLQPGSDVQINADFTGRSRGSCSPADSRFRRRGRSTRVAAATANSSHYCYQAPRGAPIIFSCRVREGAKPPRRSLSRQFPRRYRSRASRPGRHCPLDLSRLI